MAKKKSAIDKAIEQLREEIAFRQKAIDLLVQQQAAAPKRKPRAVVAEMPAKGA